MTNLTDAATKIAYRGAKQRAEVTGTELVIDDHFCEVLQRNIKARLPKALADAKEALDAHMEAQAEQTFAAEMILAGIDAANEIESNNMVVTSRFGTQ